MRHLLDLQHQLQVDSFKSDPLLLEGDERIEFIRWNVLALEDELHEMLGETGWKPWASDRRVEEGAATGELVDALHFMMNLFMAVAPRGSSIDDLDAAIKTRYLAKRERNAERQREGYDGLSSKCPGCKRDLAEVKLQYVKLIDASDIVTAFCPCGAVIKEHHDPPNDPPGDAIPTDEHHLLLPCSHIIMAPGGGAANVECKGCGKTWALRRRHSGQTWDAQEVVR